MDQKNKTRAGRRGGIMCGGDDDNNNDLLFSFFVFDLLVKKNRDEEMYLSTFYLYSVIDLYSAIIIRFGIFVKK